MVIVPVKLVVRSSLFSGILYSFNLNAGCVGLRRRHLLNAP